jgi:hypothetical protein
MLHAPLNKYNEKEGRKEGKDRKGRGYYSVRDGAVASW